MQPPPVPEVQPQLLLPQVLFPQPQVFVPQPQLLLPQPFVLPQVFVPQPQLFVPQPYAQPLHRASRSVLRQP